MRGKVFSGKPRAVEEPPAETATVDREPAAEEEPAPEPPPVVKPPEPELREGGDVIEVDLERLSEENQDWIRGRGR